MNLILKDLLNVFKIVEDVYERIRRLLVPPRAYSWQTLIYLSIFSWIMSVLSTGYVKDIVSFLGWLFLIAGTSWYTTDNPILIPGTNMPIGAVITGFLVSTLAFGRENDVITPRTIVLWPTISALIAASAEFVEGTGTESKTQVPKIEERQKIIVLIGCCMVISCWIGFYFVTDDWLNEYPSIQTDNFQRSTFILRTDDVVVGPRNGVVILDKIQPVIEEQISKKPWSEVEQWLFDARQRVARIGREVIAKELAQYDERFLWRVEPRISNPNPKNKNEYKLDLLSVWSGPSSKPGGYYLTKSCQIDPIAVPRNTDTTSTEQTVIVAEIQCGPIGKVIQGAPPPQQ